MTLLKKIGRIVGKICLGIFLFYLICAWGIIPLVAPLIVNHQATKTLKHPVRLSGVSFNPFLWRLTLKKLEITDKNKELMAGFDRLTVDVSFLSLLKKIYHVESIHLDQPKVNAALLPGGKINLMDLAPEPQSDKAQSLKKPEPGDELKKEELPKSKIDLIEVKGGRIQFDDKSVSPTFTTVLSDMNLTVEGVSTDPESLADVSFSARLDEKCAMSAEAKLKPLNEPVEMEATYTLDSYAMMVVSPYVGKYTGRELADGKLDVKLTYLIADRQLIASHQVLVQKFTFGEKVESKDALNLPFGLAVALLEDPQGRIKITLPAKGDMSQPEFEYSHLIWQTARNFFMNLVTKPFSVLGSLIGAEEGTEDLGVVKFTPGREELVQEEKDKLSKLVAGLKDRPKLLLKINGSYDPVVDWKAIKTDVFNQSFIKLKGESTKDENWVYQTLYQRRFGVRDLWQINNFYRVKKKIDYEKLNAEIKRRLIEDAPPDKLALDFLAGKRAKIVFDSITAAGLDPARVSIGNPREAQASFDKVPMEFVLTIFEDQDAPNSG